MTTLQKINKAHIINHLVNLYNSAEMPENRGLYLQSLDYITDNNIKLPKCYEGTTVPVSAIKVGSDIGKVIGGYFASSKWLETGSTKGVSGSSFCWLDVFDTQCEYKCSKHQVKPLSQDDWNSLSFQDKIKLI